MRTARARSRNPRDARSRWSRPATWVTLAGLACASLVGYVAAERLPSAAAASAPVTSTPPMGWASWNSFAAKINASVIKAQADAMVSSGMKDAGYQYVNIDEGWWQGTRDSAGNITIDQADWPGGMSAIADYIHSRGLKAGIYTDAGRDGCGYYYPTGRPAAPGSGSEGHYDQDFLQFSRWGFDFVKVDWCGGDHEGLDARTAYQAISAAITRATAATGRPMVLSICNWGRQNPWDWAPAISTMWRTSGDIIYWGQQPSMTNVLANFDAAQHPSAQSAGHYNDPDMLIAGMPGFSAAQNRTHLSLWAISGAPLLAGNDLTGMSAETRAVLTNRDVIAIDQDPLGEQGAKVADDGAGRQVYRKHLTGSGRVAVVLLNRGNAAASVTARWSDLGITGSASVRDVWAGRDLGSYSGQFTGTVPAHEAVLLVIGTPTTSPTPTPTGTTQPPTTPVTTPPTTTPVTTPPTTTPVTTPPSTGPSAACTAGYRTVSSWPGGFQGEVTVRAGSAAIGTWTVSWTLAGGQTITQVWNGSLSTNGSAVAVKNLSWNGSVPANGTTTFGYLANGSPTPPALTCTGT